MSAAIPGRRSQGVCEVVRGEHPNPLQRTCEQPATLRYPSSGGGWMRLCDEHGEKHLNYCDIWNGTEWITPDGVRKDWR